MPSRDELEAVLERYALGKTAVANAIRENKRFGLGDAELPTEEEIAAEIAALDFSRWKSVPVT
ncbi:hypothetical protein [Pseudomonas jinjuensis]|uniref:hypothetical protein n=1 Tax=Pseudomonas jinjuensis TaxID=198616 RepID=UPI00111412D7|nr:hypothetical protein [Pseudomonas jinjuensis]